MRSNRWSHRQQDLGPVTRAVELFDQQRKSVAEGCLCEQWVFQLNDIDWVDVIDRGLAAVRRIKGRDEHDIVIHMQHVDHPRIFVIIGYRRRR